MSGRFSDRGRVSDDSPYDGVSGDEYHRGVYPQMRGLGPTVTQPGTTHFMPHRAGQGDLGQQSNELGSRASRRGLYREDREDSNSDHPSTRASAGWSSTSRRQAEGNPLRPSTESNSRPAQRPPQHATGGTHQFSRSQELFLFHGTQFPPEIDAPAGFSVSGSPPPQSSERTRREDRDHVERREHGGRAARSEFFEGHRRTEQYNYSDDGRSLRNRHVEPEYYRPSPREGGHRTHRGEPQIPQGQQRQHGSRQEQRRVAPQERRQPPDDRERHAERPRRRHHDSEGDESPPRPSRRRHHH